MESEVRVNPNRSRVFCAIEMPRPGFLEWKVPLPGSIVDVRLAIRYYDIYSRKKILRDKDAT